MRRDVSLEESELNATKIPITAIGAMAIVFGSVFSTIAAEPEEARALFDGKTLDGWGIIAEQDFERHGEVTVAVSRGRDGDECCASSISRRRASHWWTVKNSSGAGAGASRASRGRVLAVDPGGLPTGASGREAGTTRRLIGPDELGGRVSPAVKL